MRLNTAKTTNAIKKHLRSKFGINVKIHSKSYAGGSSINIKYTGGINSKLVEKELIGIEQGRFDGMIDLYEYENNDFILDGQQLQRFKYAFIRREITDEFWFEIAKAYCKTTKFGFMHSVETIEDFEQNFQTLTAGHWNWRELVKSLAQNINLVTDELDKIEILDVFSTGNWRIGFIYAYNGKAYSTEDLPFDI